MDKPRYTVEIVIAAPGTPLIDPRTHKQAVDAEGIPQTSAPATCSTSCMHPACLRRASDLLPRSTEA